MTELKLEVGKTYLGRIAPDGMKHACNLWIHPETKRYVVDYLDHPYDELTPVFIKVTPVEPVEPAQSAARTPHKWAKEMHAFADGYEIEFSFLKGEWLPIGEFPSWGDYRFIFRIKPEPATLKPNSVRFLGIFSEGLGDAAYSCLTDVKLLKQLTAVRIEFNPNDQSLVSAEVVTL